MKLALSFCLAASLTSLAQSQGTTVYVDVHADGPGDGSPEAPFPKIQQAVDSLTSSSLEDVILIAPGTYSENLVLPDFTTFEMVGVEGARRTVVRPADQSQSALTSGHFGDPVVRGLTFTGMSDPNTPCVQVGMGFCRLHDCLVVDNAGAGVSVHFDLVVRRSTIAGNGIGIEFLSDSLPTVSFLDSILWGNDVADTGSTYTEGADNSIVQDDAIYCGDCIDQDPLFLDPAHHDWTLSPGSPAIGLGGGGIDAGAFPFDPAHRPDLGLLCPATANSTGRPTFLDAPYRPSISAEDFVLLISGGVPGNFGTFFYAAANQQQPFGDGVLCADGALYRLGAPLMVPGDGSFSYPVDFESAAAGSGPGALLAGTTWYFQFWYRDPQGPGGSGFNLSSALGATFWN